MTTELKSFKKYDYLITAAIAIIVIIAGININDLSFLPQNVQNYLITLIGVCAVLVKIIPTNYRVKIAENTAREEAKDTLTIKLNTDDLFEQITEYIDEEYGTQLKEESKEEKDNAIIDDLDPSLEYSDDGDDDAC